MKNIEFTFNNKSYTIEYNKDFLSDIYNITNSKTFIYITKELYESTLPEIKEELNNISLENIEKEIPDITLSELLSQKIVLIKCNNLDEDINIIQDMREKITDEKTFVIINKI